MLWRSVPLCYGGVSPCVMEERPNPCTVASYPHHPRALLCMLAGTRPLNAASSSTLSRPSRSRSSWSSSRESSYGPRRGMKGNYSRGQWGGTFGYSIIPNNTTSCILGILGGYPCLFEES